MCGMTGIASLFGVDASLSLPIGFGLMFLCFSIAQYLAYRDLQNQKKEPLPSDSIIKEVRKVIEPQDGSFDSVTSQDRRFILSQLAMPMVWQHGHMDIGGLLADRASGIALNKLMVRNCSQCGIPRNKKAKAYEDE